MRPQDAWNARHGLVSKTYKLQREIADAFDAACKAAGKSKKSQLEILMTEYVKAHEKEEPAPAERGQRGKDMAENFGRYYIELGEGEWTLYHAAYNTSDEDEAKEFDQKNLWELIKSGDAEGPEEVASGCTPCEDCPENLDKNWAAVDAQIEEELGFLPYYTVE